MNGIRMRMRTGIRIIRIRIRDRKEIRRTQIQIKRDKKENR